MKRLNSLIATRLIVLFCLIVTSESHSADITVNNTNDDGPGSLREALVNAETTPDPDAINFDIPTSDPGYNPTLGIWTIKPTITYYVPSNTIVDGSKATTDEVPPQPGIEIDGTTSVELGYTGLHVGDNAVLRGLVINHFQYGIWVEGTNTIIEYCYIGTDPTGTVAKPNGAGGILGANKAINVLIQNNLVSGNDYVAIRLFGDMTSGNIIRNNRIGTTIDGNQALPNKGNGIQLHVGAHNNIIEGNLISGNGGIGIHLLDDRTNDNILQNNQIGINASGTEALPNGTFGVALFNGPKNNMIGPGNLVANSKQYGVLVDGSDSFTSTVGNTITANSISANDILGIRNFRGGNAELTPPIIHAIVQNNISGTTAPGQRVELFSDENNQGILFLGDGIADAAGNFSIDIPPDLIMQHPFFTATATDAQGNTSEFSQPFDITAVKEQHDNTKQKQICLSWNVPNPFNPTTTITYDLPHTAHVQLTIYDVLGRQVKRLVDAQKPAGQHQITWDATDDLGEPVAAGLYFCRLEAEGFIDVIKLALVK